MCLACEEEAFYRAYQEHLAKKAKEQAQAERDAPPAAAGRAGEPDRKA